MKLTATKQGLLIKKGVLGDEIEFEIFLDNEQIIVKKGTNPKYSIWDLGSNSVDCDVRDGAIHHDRQLYNP
ncbi:hypothetical protein [Baaleninema sp.]|uniref:hypothetical protein n=1 Tax=Baaleninema sp. TaxID=3101197 RepID=UPI003D01D235